MNAFFRNRFPLLVALLVAASLTACKKAPEVDPDLGNRVAGTYTLTELVYGGQTYTGNKLPLVGTVAINRQTATTVELDLDINDKSDDSEVIVGTVEDVDLLDKGGEIELRADGDKIGRVSGNKLRIEVEDETGDSFTLVLTK